MITNSPTTSTRRPRNMIPLDLLRWLLLVPLVLAILIFCGWVALQGLSAMNVGEIVSHLEVDYGAWNNTRFQPLATSIAVEIFRDDQNYPIIPPLPTDYLRDERPPVTATATQALAMVPTATPIPTTQTPTSTITPSPVKTLPATSTFTFTPTPTHTPTRTFVPQPPQPTRTHTEPPPPPNTATSTYTWVPTFTPTHTATLTLPPPATATATSTATGTVTPTPTATSTATGTWTPTSTGIPTSTDTPTPTDTPTVTDTFTPSPTFTETPTPTNTSTPIVIPAPGGGEVACGADFMITLDADTYISYLVYYEKGVSSILDSCKYTGPDSGGMCMDWVNLDFSLDGASWNNLFFWGDANPANNGSLINPQDPSEVDNQGFPESELVGGTGVIVPVYGTYRYLRIGSSDCGPPGNGDPAEVDQIIIYP